MKPFHLIQLYKLTKIKSMNKYLIEILKLRTSVTLPGFGALMIANSKTGKIVLNQLLKYDDKVLAKFIAEKENIDLQEAQNRVSRFVKEIDSELSKGETYAIFQFGKLSKTENGSIVFVMDDLMKKKQESPIVSTPKVEKKSLVKPKVIAPKVENKKEEVNVPVNEKEAPKNVYTPPVKPKTEILKKTVEKPVEKVKEVAKVVEKTAKKVVTKVVPVVKTKAGTKIEIEKPKPLSQKEKLKQEKEANDKWKKTKLSQDDEKKKRKVWPWILLLLLIGVGVGLFMFQDKVKAMLGMSTEVEQVDVVPAEEIPVEEHVIEDAIVDSLNVENAIGEEAGEVFEENIEEETVEIAPIVQSSTSGSYHIIGGAFGEESNAVAFASKTGGIVLGNFSGMYQVAVQSYNTRAEVNSAFKSVSSDYNGAWIFKYPK